MQVQALQMGHGGENSLKHKVNYFFRHLVQFSNGGGGLNIVDQEFNKNLKSNLTGQFKKM